MSTVDEWARNLAADIVAGGTADDRTVQHYPCGAPAKALQMPPYEYQPYYMGSSSLTTGKSLLPRDWLQSEVEKVRDKPPVESWSRLVESSGQET